MKKMILAAAALLVTAGVAIADDSKKDDGAKGPGTVDAMKDATPPGVATNPQQVDKQQGKMDDKHSPGTVGAAPGGSH